VNKKGIISVALAVCCLSLLASPVLAGGLTVSGAKIDDSVKPGNDYSYTIGVQNTSDAPMDIGVEVKGYGMSANQDFIVLEPKDDSNPYTARELLTVSPASFHLEPGASQPVTVTTKIPSGIGDGGRYAIVFIHTVPAGGGQVATISAVAARVLLTISGSKLDTTSQITEVSLAQNTSQEPAGVMVTVADNGNYHYEPALQATLRNGDKVVATTSVLAPGWPIIPGYSRQYQLTFAGGTAIPAGKYDVDVEVKDESGNLITKGTFPLEFTQNQVPTPATTAPSPTTPVSPAPAAGVSWPVIVGAAAGGAIIASLIAFLLVRRRVAH